VPPVSPIAVIDLAILHGGRSVLADMPREREGELFALHLCYCFLFWAYVNEFREEACPASQIISPIAMSLPTNDCGYEFVHVASRL